MQNASQKCPSLHRVVIPLTSAMSSYVPHIKDIMSDDFLSRFLPYGHLFISTKLIVTQILFEIMIETHILTEITIKYDKVIPNQC